MYVSTYYICNMGTRDLPDMYAQARGQTYQANPNCTCYICYVILPALQKSARLAIDYTASLYNDRCC